MTWQDASGLGLKLGHESGSVVRVLIIRELSTVSCETLVAQITTTVEASFSPYVMNMMTDIYQIYFLLFSSTKAF